MYISAMWLRDANGKQGVNITLFHHPAGLPHGGDLHAIMKDPGNATRVRQELKPGGNRVQAALDLVLDDKDNAPASLRTALDSIEQTTFDDYIPYEPLKFTRDLPHGPIKGIFGANLPWQSESAKVAFRLLRDTIVMYLAQGAPERAA